MSKEVYIGTSGWHYDHWFGPFYPEEMDADEMLPFYAEHLRTAEVNNTFYQLPDAETVKQWRQRAPEKFIFAVKASRYLTHMKKLKDPEEPLANFLERVTLLEDKLGPVLFQLPPRWRFNAQRLRNFLQQLPGDHRYAFEFRDPSWFDEEAYELLQEAGAAFCIHDMAGEPSPKEVTGDFVYIRLHGPQGAYEGSYDKQSLAGWAGAISTWRQERDVYCYFNNDQAGYAVENAQQLQEMLSQ